MKLPARAHTSPVSPVGSMLPSSSWIESETPAAGRPAERRQIAAGAVLLGAEDGEDRAASVMP